MAIGTFLRHALGGKREKTQQFQRYTPQQQDVLNQLLSAGSQSIPQQTQFLQSLLSPGSEAEQAFAAPAFREFNEKIIPSIAERFTRDFGEGSGRSSAFGQQLGQAGAGLAENLAALRAQLAFQGIGGLQNLLGTGLSQQFDTVQRAAQPGLFGIFAQGLAQQAPRALFGAKPTSTTDLARLLSQFSLGGS